MRADDRLDALDEGEVVLGAGRVRLVAADVDVRAGREGRDLADDVVDEPVGQLLADAERAEADLDVRPGRRSDAVAVERRVGRERRVDVPRHVDLGHDVDEPVARVRDDRRVLALREVAALPSADR